MKPESRVLTPRDVSEMIGMSISWLEKSRLTGDGPRYLKLKGAIRYKAKDVEEWLEANTRTSTSDNGGAND